MGWNIHADPHTQANILNILLIVPSRCVNWILTNSSAVFGDFLPSDTDPIITQSHNAKAVPERKINFFPITCSIIWEALSLGLGLARISASGQAMPQKKSSFLIIEALKERSRQAF